MPNELTLQKLKDMEDGIIFGTGTGTYPELIDKEVRWIAKRGDGYHDWCIYYHHVYMDIDTIKREGDKCFTESVIKRLVPCDDEAYGMYRR